MEHKPRRRRYFDERSENRDRWIISYADFITLLFATFVVLYAISSLNTAKYRMLSESLQKAFTGDFVGHNPAGPFDHLPSPIAVPSHLSPEMQHLLEAREKMLNSTYNDLLKQLADLIHKGQITVLRQPTGIEINIQATLLFPSGSAALIPDAVQVVDQIGKVLAASPYIVQVNGFTDNAPIHSAQFDSNWELSAMRAISVVRRFAVGGVATDRLVGAGYGEFHPVAPNDSDANMGRNRRVSIVVIAPIPGADTGAIPLLNPEGGDSGNTLAAPPDGSAPASTPATPSTGAAPTSSMAQPPMTVAPASAASAAPTGNAPTSAMASSGEAPADSAPVPAAMANAASAPEAAAETATTTAAVASATTPSAAATVVSSSPQPVVSAHVASASHVASGDKKPLKLDPRLFKSRHD